MRRWGLIAAVLALCALPACRRGPPPRDGIAIAVPYELGTFDPHVADQLSHASVLTNVYEPLVTTDAELRIRPCLAESWESPDPLTWVFRLRPGVSFHSGRPLRADDVVYSYVRLLRSAGLQIRGYLLNVAEVHALDDRSVQIKTVHPSRILLNKLSHVPIVADGAASESLNASPDGTGPYRVGSRRGDVVTLVRNERYWGGAPAVGRVEFVLARPADEALRGLLDGRYQLIKCDSKRAAALAGAGRFEVLRRENIFVKYVAYDLDRNETPFCRVRPNPFKNPLVRRALQLGVDRKRLVAGLSNYAVPAYQPVPRFVFGFNPDIPEAVQGVDRARGLLRQAGLPNGFGVVLHTRRVLGEAPLLLKEQLGTLGIDVETRVLPDEAFFELLDQGATLWLNRFGCSSGDASDFLDAVVHSADPAHRFGMNNYGRHASPDLDAAIERSAGIEKPEERRNAIQEILAMVTEHLVVLPLYSDQDVYALDRAFAWDPRADSYIHVAEIRLRP